MNKKISNNMFLIALCMQYGAVKVEAVQATVAEAYVMPVQKSELTRRLLSFQDKLSMISENQLETFKIKLRDISDLLADKGEKDFKDSFSVAEKKDYISKKIKSVVEELRGNTLSKKDAGLVSSKIDEMEKVFSSKPKSSRFKSRK